MSACVFVLVMLYCGTFSRHPLKAEAVGWSSWVVCFLVWLMCTVCDIRMMVQFLNIIGASLSEPHIDRDNGPCARKNGIYLSIYVCIIYPAFVAPWFPRSVYALKCSVYDMQMCVIYN